MAYLAVEIRCGLVAVMAEENLLPRAVRFTVNQRE
jgi:hypothetical protein